MSCQQGINIFDMEKFFSYKFNFKTTRKPLRKSKKFNLWFV